MVMSSKSLEFGKGMKMGLDWGGWILYIKHGRDEGELED